MRMNTVKNRIIRWILGAFLCIALGFFFVNPFGAGAYSTLPESGKVGNLYDSATQTFNIDNLNALAKGGSFTDFKDMVNQTCALSNNTTALRNANGFGNTTVKIGSYSWIPVYLTKAQNNKDAILTLWLAEHVVSSPFATSAGSGGYYSRYRESLPRTQYLADSASASTFREYISGPISAYIVTPENVQWQRNQSLINDYNNTTFGNDWAGDKLWLPSVGDVGVGKAGGSEVYSPVGIWQTGGERNKASLGNGTWTRTTTSTYKGVVPICYLRGGTGVDNQNYTNMSCSVRPAFHLNLSKILAEESLKIPSVTGTYRYTGVSQEIDMTKLANFDADKMQVTGISREGGKLTADPAFTATTVSFTDAGTYTVTLETKQGTIDGTARNYWWYGDNATDTEVLSKTKATAKFTVKKKQLTPPKITTSDGTKIYDGTKQTLKLSGYPNAKVEDTATPATFAYPTDPMNATVTAKRGEDAYTPQYTVGLTTGGEENGTLTLDFRDAAVYTVTFTIADAENYEWSDSETNNAPTRSTTFTVNPKQLSVSYESDYKAGQEGADKTSLSWTATDDYRATFTIGYVYTGTSADFPNSDDAGVRLKLGKSNDDAFSVSVAGTLDQTTGNITAVLDRTAFPSGKYSVGTFPITFELTGSESDKGNYSLTDAITAWNGKSLVIMAASAGLEVYSYRYVTKHADAQGTVQTPAQAFENGSDGKPSYRIAYRYDTDNKAGFVYEIEIDTKDFADAKIKIDESKYDNGYKNRSASKAGKYKTTVALITTDDAYSFHKPDGTASKTLDVELEWEITKLSVDIDGVKWQYTAADGNPAIYAKWDKTKNENKGAWVYADGKGGFSSVDPGLPWKSGNHTLTMTDLPAGVSVKNGSAYTGNVQKYVGSGYSASVMGAALIYDKDNYETISIPALSWSISKAKVVLSDNTWDVAEKKQDGDEGDKIFYLPYVKTDYSAGIDYEIYDLGTDKENPDPNPPKVDLSAVTVTAGEPHYYYVKAVLKSGLSSDGKTSWADALEFVDAEGYVLLADDCKKEFETGDNRTPVSVTGTLTVRYDGKPHGQLKTDGGAGEIEVNVGGNAFGDVRLKYYRYSDSATDHKGDFLGEDVYPTDAGKYLLEVALQESASENYVLMKSRLEFVIETYRFDLSATRWGYALPKIGADGKPEKDENGDPIYEEFVYNASTPLSYRVKLDADGNPVIVDGKPVAEEQKVFLVNLPKGDPQGDEEAKLLYDMLLESGLADAIRYTGNAASAVTQSGGSNQAEYEIDLTALGNNFEIVGLPGETDLPKVLNWRIDAKKIEKPRDDASKTFDGKVNDLLKLGGLDPSGAGVYYNVDNLVWFPADGSAAKTFPKDEIPDALKSVADAGRYQLRVSLTDTANMRWDDNGILKTAPQQFEITVNKLTLTVVDWDGDGKEPWTPLFKQEIVPDVYEYEIRDEAGEIVEGDAWQQMFLKTFRQTLKAKAGQEGNVDFVYEGTDAEKEFTTPENLDNPLVGVTRPTFSGDLNEGRKEFTYNGKAQNFLPEGLEALLNKKQAKLYALDGEGIEREVDASIFTQTNAGKYSVVVRLADGYKWSDTNDRADALFEFEIKPAEIAPEWKTDANGKPIASMPEEFGKFKDAFDYHYYDESGTEVAEADLVPNQTYTVGATLKEEYAKNFVLVDGAGETLEDGISMSEEPYVHPQSGFLSFLTQPFLFGLPMWLWLIIFLILFILLLILLIVLIKGRKKRKEKRELAREKKEEEERNRQEKQEEKERAEQEKREREEERKRQQEEREEERRRQQEEREEERRRQQEEREEERRRKEEEREEERRRRQEEREEREEERRRQREEREEEMRRREEERRNASMGVGMGMMGAGMGMGMGMQQQPMQQPQMPQQPYYPPQQQPYAQQPQQNYQEQPQQTYQEQPQYQEQAQQPYETVQDPNWQEETYVYEPEEAEAEIIYADDPGQYYGQQSQAPVYVSRAGNEIMSTRLSEYEQRLREMERELQQKRIETICQEENARAQKEFEAEERKRRQEDELRRLKELQEEERRRRRELEQMPYFAAYAPPQSPFVPPQEPVAPPADPATNDRLRMLEEEIARKQVENELLMERLRAEEAAAADRQQANASRDPKR